MNAILELLNDNEPLTTQLRGATSREKAVGMIVDAAGKRGQTLTASEVDGYLAQRPKHDPEALSEEELEAISGGRPPCSIVLSDICCYTCRTSAIIW